MAVDWIKMRTDLYRDPKVIMIAESLLYSDGPLARYVSQNIQRDMAVTRNVMRNVTVGALVSVWGVMRHRGKRSNDDLVIKGCTVVVIDDVADLPGFGEAMLNAGWVVEKENFLVFPNFFEEFNVDPAEEHRKKNAERQRRFREKQRENNNVTVTLKSNDREEKRREEIKEKDIVELNVTRPHKPSSKIPYKEIVSRLNDKCGSSFRETSQKTKNHIKARFNEGFTLEDFYTVIDCKCDEWGTDDKMVKYLRPETLFGTKFEAYIQDANRTLSTPKHRWEDAPI